MWLHLGSGLVTPSVSTCFVFSSAAHTQIILSVCLSACLSVCLSVYLCSHLCSIWAQTVALNMQRCAEADTAVAQLRQQAECVGDEEARSMVQQLVEHVVTQKDKGRQAAAKVTVILMTLLNLVAMINMVYVYVYTSPTWSPQV